MTIPSPPADNSGGYLIATYTNGTDTHKMRLHVRAFNPDGSYVTPASGTPTTVMADWTQFMNAIKPFYNSAWTFSLTALFKNNGDGTFTEQFGWTSPAVVTGTGTSATPNDQTRAQETIFNFRDGQGGRGRLVLVASPINLVLTAPVTFGGSSSGSPNQVVVDALTNPTKTNIVAHSGHQMQSPARITMCVNRRLRRHYGFS